MRAGPSLSTVKREKKTGTPQRAINISSTLFNIAITELGKVVTYTNKKPSPFIGDTESWKTWT